MFTDMVGYSGLAQRDEGLAVELLEEHRALLRPAFLKHQGQEIKTIGDGFLVEFASAVAAVKCAVELQEGLARRNLGAPADRQLQVRIGIHLGDVLRRGDDIVGDGVNIAARVEPLADFGGIAITQQVFDQVYNKIPETLARIGKIELKNIQRPVEVYRIILGPKTREAAAGERETSAPARQPSREQQRSIAVLPFVNMSSDRENEFLSDGISEDLLNALSWIEGLRVAARTSCFAFKGRNEDIRTIGDALGVETVLEGSLRRVGTKLRITSNEEKTVRAADLAGLASDYKNFRSDVEKLRQESEMLAGRKVAWDEWKTSTAETIRFYLSPVGLALPEACADNAATFLCTSQPESISIAQRALGCAFRDTCRIEETAFPNGYRRI